MEASKLKDCDKE